MSKEHLMKALKANCRYDGRELLQYRDVTIESGIYKGAEGSARVKIGDTEVIAGVKMSLEKPFADRPDEGGIMVNVELLAMSNPEFEVGPPAIGAIELARVVDRGVRESHSFDLKKLIIEPGEKAWFVAIDICSVNDAGNLQDAASLAALAAVKDARFPALVDGVVDYKQPTDKKLEMEHEPIEVTVFKIGDQLIVDPILDEANQADARLTVASIGPDKICAMQKGLGEPVEGPVLAKMAEIAVAKAEELRAKLG